MEQGFEICIMVMPDGSFRVSSEPMDMAEEQAEPAGQEAGSIGEALKLALDLFKQGAPEGSADDEFASGFGTPEEQSTLTTMPKGGYAED